MFKISNSLNNPFINKGFGLIYSDKFYDNKIISKKIDERSLVIFQKNLKKNTIVKITNILNNKSIIGTVGSNADYPLFKNVLPIELEILFFVKVGVVQLFNKIKQHKINSFL